MSPIFVNVMSRALYTLMYRVYNFDNGVTQWFKLPTACNRVLGTKTKMHEVEYLDKSKRFSGNDILDYTQRIATFLVETCY